jgi:hypothetical protein
MTWYVEQLQRDGAVLSRLQIEEGTGVIRIGRAFDNDVVLDDPHCALHHAQLELAADGSARLVDLNSKNGIIGKVSGRNKRAPAFTVSDDAPYRLGQTPLRIRSSAWALPPERVLSRRRVWLYALIALLVVFAHGAWDIWLGDVQTKSPAYLNQLSGLGFGLAMWSGMYALLSRIFTGAERFFSHLLIACTGCMSGTLLLYLLELLSFSMGWLWPIRITDQAVIIVAACTVSFHVRLADPRHWPTSRIVVILIAAGAIIVPLTQRWVSHGRLTDVQTLYAIKHPALRLTTPVPVATFSDSNAALKAKVDKARKAEENDNEWPEYDAD